MQGQLSLKLGRKERVLDRTREGNKENNWKNCHEINTENESQVQ